MMAMEGEGRNTLHDLVEENLSQYEDKVAILYDTGDSKDFVTYKEMWSETSLIRDALEKFSAAGEVVGLCLEQDKHIPALILGVLCSGAAFYNFEPASTGFVIQVIRDIHVRILIVDIKFLNALQDLIFQLSGQLSPFSIPGCPHIVLVELLSVARKQHSSDLAYCITTSGTTGQPKIVQVPHRCIVPNITDIRSMYNLTPVDLVLLCSPLTFDPCIVELFTSLSVGACVLIVPRRVKASPKLLLEMIYHSNKVTVMQCTPSLLRRWDPVRLRDTILGNGSSLSVLSLGGERFPAFSELERMRDTGNQTKFYNLYGITEVSSWATCYEVTDLGKDSDVHLGFPLSGTEIMVCDDRGQRIEEGVGKIYIGGKQRQCIIGVEEETQYDISQIMWRDTGDRGRIKDGRIYYVGREDSQIKRHGKRLNLEEINHVVRQLENIRCCTTQLIDNNLVVFIMTHLPTDHLNPANDPNILPENARFDNISTIKTAVIDRIRCQLPSHYTPDDVVVIDSLPVTKHGKVDITELTEIYRKKQEPYCKNSKPFDCLTKAWKEVLCIDRTDSILDGSLFLEAGGDSFKAIKLLDNIESQLECKFPNFFDWIMNQPFGVLCEYVKTECEKAVNLIPKKEENLNGESKWILNFDKEDMTSHLIYENKEVLFTNRTKAVTTDVLRNDDNGIANEITDDIVKCKSTPSDMTYSKEFRDKTEVLAPNITNSDAIEKHVLAKSLNHGSSISTFPDTNMVSNVDNNFISYKTFNFLKTDIKKAFLDSVDSSKAGHKRFFEIDSNAFEDKMLKNRRILGQKFYMFIQRGNRIYNIPDVIITDDNNQVETSTQDKTSVIDQDSVMNAHEIRESKIRRTANDYNMLERDRSLGINDNTVDIMVVLKKRWSYNTGKCVDASPLLAVSRKSSLQYRENIHRDEREDLVFIGSHSHKFSAVSMATGNAIWEITLGDRIESSACMSRCGSYVIVGCYDGNIYTIDAQSGHIYWQFQTGAEVKSSPTVDMVTGLVYVGSHSHCLYALNTETRECVWRATPGCGSIFSSPCIWHSPHRVYVGTLGGYLLALHALSGEEAWRHNVGKPIFSSPCVTEDGILVGCVDNYIYQLSHTGTRTWRFETKGPVFSSPVIWNSHSEILPLLKEKLSASDMETGEINSKPCKKMSCGDRMTSDVNYSHGEASSATDNKSASVELQLVCEIGKRIICGCHGNSVYCLTVDGKLIWEIETDSSVYSTPFVDRIYITNQNSGCRAMNRVHSSENEPKTCFEDFKNKGKEQLCNKTFGLTLDPSKNPGMTKCGRNCYFQEIEVVAFASTKGCLYLLNIEDGTVLCRRQMKGEIFSSPVLYRNCLVVGCRNDRVYCFDIIVNVEERNSKTVK